MTYILEINGWKSGIRFSSAHLLPGHKKCSVLHGHTYAIHAKFYGEKDKQDFVIDFSIVKSTLRKIADRLDHTVLIPENSTYVETGDKEIQVVFDSKKYVFPREDCILLPIRNVTAENLAEFILEEFLKEAPPPQNVKKIELGVDEGYGQGAWIEKNVG